MKATRPTRALVAVAGLAFVALVASACGSSSSNSSSGSSGGASSGDTQAASLLQSGYAGTFSTPPSSGPKAATGKKVWVISCGQVAASCAVLANAAMDGGKAAGWTMHLYDAALNPANYTVGINQAIAAGASGIVTVATDCQLAKTALESAKTAGVVTIPIIGYDCDDPLASSQGTPLYSSWIKFHGADTNGAAFQQYAALKAAWLIGKANSQAQVIATGEPGFIVSAQQAKGFNDEMATCSTCKILTTVNFAPTDFVGNTAVTKYETALQKYPTANGTMLLNDSFFQQFGNQALQSVGYSNLSVMGGECAGAEAITAIKAGGPQQACVAYSPEWIGWAAIDEMNRQFATPGSAPVDEGIGFQVVDKDHNLPSGSVYTVPVDFESAYNKVWTGQ